MPHKAVVLGSAVYAGGSPGVDYPVTQLLNSQTNETVNISHPAPGYVGTLDIFLAGYAAKVGIFWSPDNKGGPQASGETAYFHYTCLGDETSFSLQQIGINATDDSTLSSVTLKLIVNGGVNDGKFCSVGSGMNQNGYGAAGCPVTRAGMSTLLSASKHGACQDYSGIVSYSDGTNYSAALKPTYGDSSVTYTISSHTLTVYYASAQGGLIYDGSAYGRSIIYTPSLVTSGNAQTRVAGNYAMAILVFRNDA